MKPNQYLPQHFDQAEAAESKIRKRLHAMYTAMDNGFLEDLQQDALALIRETQVLVELQAKRQYYDTLRRVEGDQHALRAVKKLIDDLETEGRKRRGN